MNCPTCNAALHEMGCQVTGDPLYWCLSCGTLQTCDGHVLRPLLVDSCRKFGGWVCAAFHPFHQVLNNWRRIVTDTTNLTGKEHVV